MPIQFALMDINVSLTVNDQLSALGVYFLKKAFGRALLRTLLDLGTYTKKQKKKQKQQQQQVPGKYIFQKNRKISLKILSKIDHKNLSFLFAQFSA